MSWIQVHFMGFIINIQPKMKVVDNRAQIVMKLETEALTG